MSTNSQRNTCISHPISLVFNGRKLYVTNMDSDSISVINTESDILKTAHS